MKLESPVILDGGLATELEMLGYKLDHSLWSASLLLTQPEAIYTAHQRYLEAGADCILTSAYQASVWGLEAYGLSRPEARAVLKQSSYIALKARADMRYTAHRTRQPLVAASVGPYGAYLADGSEYRGAYNLSSAELMRFHAERWDILSSSGVDLLACETMPSWIELTVLVELFGRSSAPPGWISLVCRDEQRLADGTPLTDVVRLVQSCPKIVGLGVNCISPNLVSSVIRCIKDAGWAQHIVVYPNSGEVFDVERQVWGPGNTELHWTEQALEWHALGATIIGGCCRTTSDDIRRLKEVLRDHKRQLN